VRRLVLRKQVSRRRAQGVGVVVDDGPARLHLVGCRRVEVFGRRRDGLHHLGQGDALGDFRELLGRLRVIGGGGGSIVAAVVRATVVVAAGLGGHGRARPLLGSGAACGGLRPPDALAFRPRLALAGGRILLFLPRPVLARFGDHLSSPR